MFSIAILKLKDVIKFAIVIVVAIFIIIFCAKNLNSLSKILDQTLPAIKNMNEEYRNISKEEDKLESSGTITNEEVSESSNVINNIPIISKEAVVKTLEDNQTKTGYYTYRNANLAKYKIDGKDQLVYVSPREITNLGRTYNNKTYEYTHGMGQIITSATQSSETGNTKYIQKDVSGKDEQIKVSQPRMYFGVGNKETIATNAKNKQRLYA